ncbi:MAG: oxidoreductase [Pseudonocardia sp. SCN 72-86]|nr:MAG: oxidoreductase [Pseudonocardia sp. SCN 72-86]
MARQQTRFTTSFGATTTAVEVLDGVDLRGRTAVVTGGSSGIGAETARVLTRSGARVVLAVRDVEAGRRTADMLVTDIPAADVEVRPLDLADPATIAAFVADWHGPLHVLVANAGVMGTPLLRTAAGWELQFGTNHVGHFLLATGLHSALAAAGGARVVVVSSNGHRRSPVVFDDVQFERRPYDPWLAYGQSKTANVLFAVEAARRWSADGIEVNALHPGAIVTNIQRWVDRDEAQRAANAERRKNLVYKSVQQGAATSALLAGSPLVAGVSGRYFEDCNEAEPAGPGALSGVQSFAVDPSTAERLWSYTSAITS